jgi:hypothetical protein
LSAASQLLTVAPVQAKLSGRVEQAVSQPTHRLAGFREALLPKLVCAGDLHASRSI